MLMMDSTEAARYIPDTHSLFLIAERQAGGNKNQGKAINNTQQAGVKQTELIDRNKVFKDKNVFCLDKTCRKKTIGE